MADPQEQLRDVLAAGLHKVDCGCQSKVHTDEVWDHYLQLVDAVLALGEVAEDGFEVHKDDEEWAGGGWVSYYKDWESASKRARDTGAGIRARVVFAVDIPGGSSEGTER